MALIRKLNVFLSLLMMMVLFYPSLIKLDHHHNFYTIPSAGDQITITHEKCAVCSFEFSLFLSDDAEIASGLIEDVGQEYSLYDTCHYISVSEYTYLLRAPPLPLS